MYFALSSQDKSEILLSTIFGNGLKMEGEWLDF